MTGPHMMDAIRWAVEEAEASGRDASWTDDLRQDLLAVLRHLPAEMTVGEILVELEHA